MKKQIFIGFLLLWLVALTVAVVILFHENSIQVESRGEYGITVDNDKI